MLEGEISDRSFGLRVGGVLLGLSCVPLLRHHRPPVLWMAVAGLLLVAIGLVAPAALRQVKRAWLSAGVLLGLAVSPVALGILFYGVVTPCGVLLRWCGGDALRLRPNHAQSHWQERSSPVSSMNDQF